MRRAVSGLMAHYVPAAVKHCMMAAATQLRPSSIPGRYIVRRFLFPALLWGALCAAPIASYAQTPLANRAPGVWELRLVDGSSLASLALGVQQAFKNLPEGQRKQMEQLMGGSRLPLPTTIRYCLTSDMVGRDLKSELASHDIQCSELEWQESGGTGRFSFVCTNPDGDWTGDGRIWDATDKHFMSEAKVQGKYKGQPVALDVSYEAQWLGPDCQAAKTQ